MRTTNRIFVDANIFTYVLTEHPRYNRRCLELLNEIEQGDREGSISPLVIDEVAYILMVQKARELTGIGSTNALKEVMLNIQEEILDPIDQFYDFIDHLVSFGHLKVLSMDYSISKIAHRCMREYCLLPRDALHVACCKAYGIEEMATNDRDFEKVGDLRLWKP